MPERRRTLLDIALDNDSLVGGILGDVRTVTRRRIVNEVLDGVVAPHVDTVLDRIRRRP